ncbi:MAG: flavodoxin-dependent (E)-4-hydroxy-3-methylbut-2-enyl-diphosphate synthase, partial [SAR324 cluster bacterium]|nr:flavodoxin-dependent (E)-4-hydroxy-3-methylbut-2-enyl-diphosphate synthase [SAR324 cluster bacterium]
MDYPLHLGVTEAGNGSEGRIKSAVGIGGLLCQGLGDTIRVSLTEPAENEIPAAKAILGGVEKLIEGISTDLGENERFEEKSVSETTISPNQNQSTLRIQSGKTSVKSILLKPSGCKIGDRETFKLLSWKTDTEFTDPKKVFDAKLDRSDGEQVLLLNEQEIETGLDKTLLDHLKSKLLVLEVSNPLYTIRNLNQRLEGKAKPAAIGYQLPIIETMEDHLGLAAELGELISCRELHALICRDGDPESLSARFAQNLMQATRVRMFQADFISCPSCGRTFFDLQQTTEQLKRKTAHLTGVKIAVMGCVVNGPGEMADADYGYVGAGPGKIHLYRGQQCVQRNIPSHDAVDKLIDLIRSEGRWIEPVEASAA